MTSSFSEEGRSGVSPGRLFPGATELLAKDEDRTRLPTRVSNACERCRRHKSRCDEYRPCSLCQRANVQCLRTAVGAGRSQKKRRVQGNSVGQIEPLIHADRPDPDSNGNGALHGTDVSLPNSTNTDASLSRTGSVPQLSPMDYREAESTMGITRKIFKLGSQSLSNLVTSAIPDGEISPDASSSVQATSNRLPIASVLGCSLPHEDVMRVLLEAYFDSVHWFSLVIYEPSFRIQFESICDGYASPLQKSFLLLLSTVLGIAAWYCSKRTSSERLEIAVDWSELASKLLKHIESQLFDIIDQNSLATIQTCTLLASYHSYHGKPKAAFSLLGATIKTAQAIGLHRECSREGIEISEEKKRAWWTIYTWDRWASITYGRPLGINEKDCSVSMPADIFENRRFKAVAPDQNSDLICYSAYQRELNKLYVIASPMIETIFGIRSSSNSGDQTPKNVYSDLMKNINRRLNDWRQRLPPHLVFDFDNDIAPEASATIRSHRLQALALQLTFDHLVIVFHRPFLAQQVSGLSQGNSGSSLSPSRESPALSHEPRGQSPSSFPVSPQLPSSSQWWSAAIRTSRVTQLPQIARLATDGHLVAFLAINLFNSAVVMVVCAMSDPLSDRAQEAKRNITRISRLQELLGKQSQLSMQSSVVLRDMILMIVQREAEAMLASIQPTKDSEGDDANNKISPYYSVEDALRLPLSTPFDYTGRSRLSGELQENFRTLPDETLRLNESLASLQRIFPGNEFNTIHYDNEAGEEQSMLNFERSLNMETWRNNLQQHSVNNAGKRPFDSSGEGDDLYWIWNSMTGNSSEFL